MRRTWCVVAATLLAAGCGGSGGPVLPVHGTVTMDGKPLDGAAVTFYPDEKSGGTNGFGRTGSDGKFVIAGAKGEKGLPAGQYKVTISRMKGGAAPTDEEVIAAPSEAEIRSEDLPPHYSNPAQTKLAYTVTGDGEPIKIDLTSGKKK